MNTTRFSMGFLLAVTVALVLAIGSALTGCATGQQLHGDTPIDGPTALVTGPARGHWAEQDDHGVIVYTVMGTNCTDLVGQDRAPVVQTHGNFLLAPGITLCVIPLRDKTQRVLFHAERP
jgi:hypothetical protein